MLKRGRLSVALALLAAASLAPATARAQVFLATEPNPEFEIGPLFVRATVTPALGPLTVDLLWSLAIPPTRSALGLEQDLYLLWPGPVRGEGPAPADHALAEYVAARGFAVLREGTLPLSEQDLYRTADGTRAERPLGHVPFVTFSRQGLGAIGLTSAASYVKIPWTPALLNRVRLVRLRLVLDDPIRRRPASWLDELIWGRRYRLSLGFDDVREQTLFPVYLENRSRVVRLADEPSQILLRFAEARRLRVDEVFPQSASRRPGAAGRGTEIVSLFLDATQGLAPQVLSVSFGYSTRLQAWAPILIPVLFFVLGRAAGPLVERLARQFGRSVTAHLHFGRQSAAGVGTREGVIVSRETLAKIVTGRTTYEEVLALCGRDVLEEREDLAAPGRRTLLYRGRRVVPQRRRSFALFATVSHWETESQETEIAIADGVVKDVQVRVRRTRLPYPDTA